MSGRHLLISLARLISVTVLMNSPGLLVTCFLLIVFKPRDYENIQMVV